MKKDMKKSKSNCWRGFTELKTASHTPINCTFLSQPPCMQFGLPDRKAFAEVRWYKRQRSIMQIFFWAALKVFRIGGVRVSTPLVWLQPCSPLCPPTPGWRLEGTSGGHPVHSPTPASLAFDAEVRAADAERALSSPRVIQVLPGYFKPCHRLSVREGKQVEQRTHHNLPRCT